MEVRGDGGREKGRDEDRVRRGCILRAEGKRRREGSGAARTYIKAHKE